MDNDDEQQSFLEGSLPPEFSETQDGTSDFERLENAVLSSPELRRTVNRNAERVRGNSHSSQFDSEKQQLLHDLHLSKMDISKKVLQMDSMKADHMALVEEMEDRIQELEHQKRLLQTKLDSQQNVHSNAEDEMNKRHEAMRVDVEKILKRQHDLELINDRLQHQAGDVRRVLSFSTFPQPISGEKLANLRSVPAESLSLRDFAVLKVHELMSAMKEEVSSLRQALKEATDEVNNLKTQYENIVDKLTNEHQQHTELIARYQKLSIELKDTQKLIKEGDYRINNYDHVKKERDSLVKELDAQQAEFRNLEMTYKSIQRERDELKSDLSSATQSVSLLQRDKEFLGIQNVELSEKLASAEERLASAQAHAQSMQKAREETYEKYVASRHEDRYSYDDKLRHELSEMKARHEQDLATVKASLVDLHERERKSLKEAYELMMVEKNRALSCEQEVKEKNDLLWQELQRVKADAESRVTRIESDAKVKLFEADRTVLSLEEALKNSRNLHIENEKLAKKLKLVSSEYNELQSQCQREISDLKHQLKLKENSTSFSAKHQHLPESDLLEKLSSRFDSQKLSDDYTTYQKISVLERANESLQSENRALREELESKASELLAVESLMDGHSAQPYQLLMSKIKMKEVLCNKKDRTIKNLESENSDLNARMTQLQFDVEKLLNNRKEIVLIKEHLRRILSEEDRKIQAIDDDDGTVDDSSKEFSQIFLLPQRDKKSSSWAKKLLNKP